MRKQKGITLIALTITIIVMMIIASITVYYGKDLIKQAKLQDLVTNMLLIQAKAKESVEEVNFQKANIVDETEIEKIKQANLRGTKVSENADVSSKVSDIIGTTDNCYYFTEQDLIEMGLKELRVEEYGYFVAVYNIEEITVEIINTNGYQGNYTLTQLKALQEE